MSLATKFRPKCWADVIGQNAVVSILSRQIATKSWKNVYLFTGSFGCGKTTCARIFANEINNGEGTPIEIDAASNNGVDNIRNLIAEAQQSALDCDYKVVILDEVHMLTTQAWNAALKIVEEPPRNTVFIFCTTNPEKIPQTILSRVQRFDFKRVSFSEIADRLEFIMNEEVDNGEFERTALERIAIASDGHVRDAIQFLEKCLDVTNNITIEIVDTVLGLTKSDTLINIINSVSEKNLENCIKEVENLKSSDADMVKAFDSLYSFSIDCAILSNTNNISYTTLPRDYKDKLNLVKPQVNLLMSRLAKFRSFINQSNAESFIKTVLVEVCE